MKGATWGGIIESIKKLRSDMGAEYVSLTFDKDDLTIAISITKRDHEEDKHE